MFQIAANEEMISVDELYSACNRALEMCSDVSTVARVIARPYSGKKAGERVRTSDRHDYSVEPRIGSML
ncbi:phosphopentomutase, partial [Cetobacterium somerae]|nr:phosphopentomutase [Cetobacterium somerae]